MHRVLFTASVLGLTMGLLLSSNRELRASGTSGRYLLDSSIYQIGARAVPEPSGLVLVLTGLVALLRTRRRG
jgi:hypothetical protein